MSWKGFKKAMTRLPQQVLQKAGYADETFDEEFEGIDGEFQELEHSAKGLSEESRAYLTAIKSLMTAQQAFGTAFRQLMHLNEEEPRSEYEAAAEGYMTTTNTWAETMGPYVDQTLQSIVLDPASALVTITKQARGSVEKRGRKVVDFDRTRNALKKAKEKLETGNTADVNKVTKAELEFAEAKKDYESLNERLKYEIPVLMKLRIDFMDPLLEALISFQIYFFEQGAASLNSLSQYIEFSTPIEETYHTKKAPAIEFMKSLSLVIPIKIDSEADPSSRAEYQGTGKSENPPSYDDSSPTTSVAKPMAIATPVAAPKAAQEESGDVLAISVYPFRSDTAGDLTFEKDEKIHIVQKSENQEDWWFGRIGSREGYFPANYVKLL